MKTAMQKAIALIEALKVSDKIHPASKYRLDEISFYPGYAEPGYDDPESGCVAVGNWNNADIRSDVPGEYWKKADNTMERVSRVFQERWGIELEWSDEWFDCSECGKPIRCNADSYQWKPSYFMFNECEPVCEGCIQENEGLIESMLEYLEDNPSFALTLDIDPAEHGYIKLNEDAYENGWHPGQDDSPNKIAESLRSKGASKFIFTYDESSQFYCRFSVWIHEDEKHLIHGEPVGKQVPSPSEILQAQLKGL